MSAVAVSARNVAVVAEIPVDAIEVGANVRVDPGELEGLAASIRDLGVLQPVKVVEHPGGTYRLVFGQRRLLASRLAGRDTIPAIVVDASDIDMPGPNRAIEQLVENLDRRDLNPIEEATALREVLDANAGTLTQAALAERLGRSPSWLSNSLRLLGLAGEVQEKVRTGEISAAHGKAIAALPAKQQRELASIVSADGMSAHRLEQEIAWKRATADQDERRVEKTGKWIPKAIAALEAAGVGKDVDVSVNGSAYDLDIEAICRAVASAGWKGGNGGSFGTRPERCDCNAVRIEVGGRKAVIEPRCVDRRHADQQVNDDHLARRAREEARERQQTAIVAALEGAVRASSLPTPVLRLVAYLVRRGAGYYTDWADIAGRDRDGIIVGLLEHLRNPWSLNHIDLEGLLAELGPDLPAVPESTPAAATAGDSQEAAKARVAEKRAARRAAAEATLEADRGVDAPLCTCGKPKVDAGHARWVCTNPEHDPKADRSAEPEPSFVSGD